MFADLDTNWYAKIKVVFVPCGGMRFIFFLLVFSQGLFAQELTLVNKTALNVNRFIGFDSYNHIYFTKNNVLHKEGDLGTFVFQDFQLGPISSVDIINPLNIVVFYAEMNTVVFLDNRLNEIERINFNDLPSFLNVSTVTNAGNNNLWVFNIDSQQLELYQYRNQLQTQVSQPYKGKLMAQISNFNECTLLTENYIRRINRYGSLLSEIPIKGCQTITQHDKTIVAVKENSLVLILENTVYPIPFPFNENPIKDLQLTQDFLYIYDSKILYTFTLTQPKQ